MLRIIFAVLFVILAVCALLVLFYRFWFLRRPFRKTPPGNVVVSPADGKIVRILETGKSGEEGSIKKGLLGRVSLLTRDIARNGYVVVIMMTPMNVHYQRSPVEGAVENVKYSRGKFLNAVKDASSLAALQNEKNEITIRNRKIGRIKVVQVAGFLARRIRCFVKKGQKLDKGEGIGLICLGSQVILVLPKLRLLVREGQRVVDGQTVIARF